MKIKYIIISVITLAIAAAVFISLLSNKTDYTDYNKARSTGKIYHIKGSWNKNKPTFYNSEENIFSFSIIDESGSEFDVDFNGASPPIFQTAPSIVVKGRVEGGKFKATELLTQCPSKYNN